MSDRTAIARDELLAYMTSIHTALRLRQANRPPSPASTTLAETLSRLAELYSALEDKRAAARAYEDAIVQYRTLVGQGDSQGLPELGICLHNLGNMYSDLGERDRAILPALEAATIHRHLAEYLPERFRHVYATSLMNLANRQREVGALRSAIDAGTVAMHLHQELARERPEQFLPGLAISTGHLGNIFDKAGEIESALECTLDAERMFRVLAQQQPEPFARHLARTLHELSERLTAAGETARASENEAESQELYRALGEAPPRSSGPGVVRALNNLAACLHDQGLVEQAQHMVEHAITRSQILVTNEHGQASQLLATSYKNLAVLQVESGQLRAALPVLVDAIGLYRAVLSHRQLDSLGDFVDCLPVLARIANELSQVDVFRDVATSIVRQFELRAEEQPDAYRPIHAELCSQLAQASEAIGEVHSAAAYSEQAVEACRLLVTERPDEFRPALAIQLHFLGTRLDELGEIERAIVSMQEAVAIHRQLNSQGLFSAELAVSLHHLGECYVKLGQHEEALPHARETVTIARQLVAARPEEYVGKLALALHALAQIEYALDNQQAAHMAMDEALAMMHIVNHDQESLVTEIPEEGDVLKVGEQAVFLLGQGDRSDCGLGLRLVKMPANRKQKRDT